MNRSAQIREVYAELRFALGESLSEFETLEHATALVNLFAMDGEDAAKFELNVGGVPFNQWALDIALADGGWRVLGSEPWLIREIEEEEEYEQLMYQNFSMINEEGVAI